MKWQNLPPLLLYPPIVVPAVIINCIRHLVLPSVILGCNPALPYSGLPMGSKKKILDVFPSNVLRYNLIPYEWDVDKKAKAVDFFLERSSFPLIVKPDTGHRGLGVTKVSNRSELIEALASQKWDMMLQEYSAKKGEFGVFYMRIPGEKKGRIVSLTRKDIPFVTGDGVTPLNALIKKTPSCSHVDLGAVPNPTMIVPNGDTYPVLVTASHCRGAAFYNLTPKITPKLEETFNTLCHNLAFYYGRFDVKAESLEDLESGNFDIIEVNGATSEFIHIYDDNVTYWQGMSELWRQWKYLFLVSSKNKRFATMSLVKFVGLFITFFQDAKRAVGTSW